MTPDCATILRLITRLNIGGPARQALLLTRELADDLPTRLAAGEVARDEGELADPAVDVVRIPLVRPISPASDARALLAVRRLISQLEVRLVHTHMAKAGTVGRLAAITSRPRPRTVHTFHGHVLEGYFRPSVQRAFIAAERQLARRTDALVAVSAEIRDQLLELGIGRPEQYHVIPLGLDLATHLRVESPTGALRDKLGIDADALLVGSVGRLVPIKDHETLLQAWTGVPDAHLAIVGDGELRPRLEALVERLGLGERVHFTGWMLDVPAVMSDLDLVVLSSRNEGTPVSLIEAAACGRAVVATSVGGVPSVVDDGTTGLLIPAGDHLALADAIRALLADPARRQRFGAAGRAGADRFTGARLADDLRRLYAGLLV